VASAGEEPRDIGAGSVAAGDDLDLLRRRLANVIGHALRTPTATVRGQAEILAETDDPEIRRVAVDALRRTSRRLEEMIDEVLVVEGIDTRLPTGAVMEQSAAEVAREVAAGLDVVDDLEVEGDVGALVCAGRDALRWILRAVLDNAGRYGTGPVRLRVTAGDDGTLLRVSSAGGTVAATDDDLRLAFEPFYRGERAVPVSSARLGLGLTTARRLVEEGLGGRIWLERDDDGVVTLMELPCP
jgi:signal transduction histidine kinase